MPRHRAGMWPLADIRERVAAGAGELAGEREMGKLEGRQVRPATAARRACEPAARGAAAVGEDDATRVLAALEPERGADAAHLQVTRCCLLDCRGDAHRPSSCRQIRRSGIRTTQIAAYQTHV